MSSSYVADSAKYISQSSAYVADTAAKNVSTAGVEVAKAGSYLTETVGNNKDIQGQLAGGVAQDAKNAEMSKLSEEQRMAVQEARNQVEAAKADTLAKMDNDMRKQARASQTSGLAGNILTGGRGVRRGEERTARALLGA